LLFALVIQFSAPLLKNLEILTLLRFLLLSWRKLMQTDLYVQT
jgi:hypothetical protein